MHEPQASALRTRERYASSDGRRPGSTEASQQTLEMCGDKLEH